ncbi:TPA: hypothetical protein ACH3X2_010078 [Trebouxia sp. C0005]
MAPRMGRGVLSSLVVIGLCFGQAQCRRLTAEEQQNAFLTQGSSSSKTYSPPPPPPADCFCSMYCNYCDSSHREQFSMTEYSCNSTYDSSNLQRCTDDLYTEDDVERSYETYMDYWCDLLYDSSTGKVKTVSGVSCSTALKSAISTSCPRHYTCQDYCEDHKCPASPPPPPKSASPPPPSTKSPPPPAAKSPPPPSSPSPPPPKSSPPPPSPPPPSPPPPKSSPHPITSPPKSSPHPITSPPKSSPPPPSPPPPKSSPPPPSPPPPSPPPPTSSPTASPAASKSPPPPSTKSPPPPPTKSPPPPPPSTDNCTCSIYCNYCDEPHRTTFDLTDHTCNSTYDSANLARCEDDLYHADSVNWNYEGYMDYWCDLLYDSSSGGVKSVSDVSCSDEWKAKIPTSCPRHYKCQDYCEDYKCPASPPPPPKSASPPPPTTKSPPPPADKSPPPPSSPSPPPPKSSPPPPSPPPPSPPPPKSSPPPPSPPPPKSSPPPPSPPPPKSSPPPPSPPPPKSSPPPPITSTSITPATHIKPHCKPSCQQVTPSSLHQVTSATPHQVPTPTSTQHRQLHLQHLLQLL